MNFEILNNLEKELKKTVGLEKAREVIERTKRFNSKLIDVLNYYSVSINDLGQFTSKNKLKVVLDVDNGLSNYKVDLIINTLKFYNKNKEEFICRGVIGEGKAYLQDGKIEDITGKEFTAWNIKSIEVNK